MALRTRHLSELNQYRFANRDVEPLTAIRCVLADARGFMVDGLTTSVELDEDAGEARVTVLRADAPNQPRALAETLHHRFGLDVEREGDVVHIPLAELET